MSIVISNISEQKVIPYSKTGLQYYRVYLNNIPLTEFTHTSELGMDVCLLKASEAVSRLGKEGIDEKIKFYKESKKIEIQEALMRLAGYDRESEE